MGNILNHCRLAKVVVALEKDDIPEHITQYLGAIHATSGVMHKNTQSRMISCLTSTASKRKQNGEIEPFMLASMFRAMYPLVSTSDTNGNQSTLKGIREQFNKTCLWLKLEGSLEYIVVRLLNVATCEPAFLELLRNDVSTHGFSGQAKKIK